MIRYSPPRPSPKITANTYIVDEDGRSRSSGIAVATNR
jgi:hypothetical protein